MFLSVIILHEIYATTQWDFTHRRKSVELKGSYKRDTCRLLEVLSIFLTREDICTTKTCYRETAERRRYRNKKCNIVSVEVMAVSIRDVEEEEEEERPGPGADFH